MDFFRPGAVVLQMGADSLAGDKLGGFNLTLNGELLVSRYGRKLTHRTLGMRTIHQVIRGACDDARWGWIHHVS